MRRVDVRSCDVMSMLIPGMSDVSQAKESIFSFRKAISSTLIEPLSSEPMFTHLSGYPGSAQYSVICGWAIYYDEAYRFSDSSCSNYKLDSSESDSNPCYVELDDESVVMWWDPLLKRGRGSVVLVHVSIPLLMFLGGGFLALGAVGSVSSTSSSCEGSWSFGALWSIWDVRSKEGLGAWTQLSHTRKDEGGTILKSARPPTRPSGRVPQLDRPSFNSIELRSQQSNPKNVASPLTSL
ncbi:unnamed protein product [Microthlaspi erraticum]|uniref:Uncharacterized protein n=1 Tax=Microthlaspi erraticum TaxID=1685480 RepID=A0A6D2I8X6_9BRAS|nr:unnamed protein product [Microthlaspi erraticum]